MIQQANKYFTRSRPAGLIIEPAAAGIIIILFSIFSYSEKSPISTILMSFFSTLIAILLITKIILIFIREHDQVMRLTNARANIIGLWALGPIMMACLTEVLVLFSVGCACLRYADIVERLQVYLKILKKYNITEMDQIRNYYTSRGAESDTMDNTLSLRSEFDDERHQLEAELEERIAAEANEVDYSRAQEMDAEADMMNNDNNDVF